MRPRAALSFLLCRLENLRAQLKKVQHDIKIADFNIGFLPLILRPKLLPGWEDKRVYSVKREFVVKEQIKVCRKAMVPCVAFIAMGKCLPNELVDMIQHLIGSEDPVVAVWDDRTGPMATAHALKKRMEGKATVPDMEAEMARLYEVAKLADMEEIVAHFEDLGRRHRIAGVVVPKYSG